ncbi:DUF3617 domain-containing protein [Andreprevotia chitinilytica]|uniref:DUF3617 domain-containing protein n=1 Tax=Andreprevotia chitinilytica TaxID=396808 RepID=UPI000553BD33|nr:DUF3617 family protein [Andreprevotia chitinilytica]
MRHTLSTALLTTTLLVPGALFVPTALASDLPSLMPSEGQWAITTEMPPEQKAAMSKMDARTQAAMKQHGMSIDPQAGTMTMTMCLNKENINKWHEAGEARRAQSAANAKSERQCDAPKYNVSGNTLTMDMKCTKPEQMSMHSVFQFNSAKDSYTFEHQITTPKREMHIKGSARKIGSC